MNDFLQQFLIESRELIFEASEGLLLLEKSPQDVDRLDTVFRAFHTLKGGAGIVEFAAMESALHAAETLLMDARAGKRVLNPALVGDCLATLDLVSQWLDLLEQSGELPVVSIPQADDGAVVNTAFASAESASADGWVEELVTRHPDVADRATTAFRFTPDRDCFYQGDDPIAWISATPHLLALDVETAGPWPSLDNFDPYVCNIVLTGLTGLDAGAIRRHMQNLSGEHEAQSIEAADKGAAAMTLPEVVLQVLQEQLAVLEDQESAGAAGRLASAGLTAANALRFCRLDAAAEDLARATQRSLAEKSPRFLHDAVRVVLTSETAATATPLAAAVAPSRNEMTTRTLRVNAAQIDGLVRLTGELTVAKNAIAHTARLAQTNGDSVAAVLKDHYAVFNRLIAQLQTSVIGMRVLPLRTVFQRFPRVLREMSLHLGKPAELKVEGEETEADKIIVEMLFEPLVHVVRNAIDHGIEDAERRRAQGKPAGATILMRASREGDQVLVEVSDDGAGIDVDRIRAVATARRVASAQALQAMADADVIDLVFAPGFSTAARVTEISGRGVGMDAVRSAVEKIGGRVSIATRPTQGTTVRFSLPFSVMMSQIMTVVAGGQAFGIPVDAVVETVHVAKDGFSGVGDARVIVQRNRTIPIIDLGSVLHGVPDKRRRETGDATVIIAAVAGQLVGLQVDRVGERMEVILKPLDGLLSGTPGIAGTTVLGDGRVLLVLDILGIVQ